MANQFCIGLKWMVTSCDLRSLCIPAYHIHPAIEGGRDRVGEGSLSPFSLVSVTIVFLHMT